MCKRNVPGIVRDATGGEKAGGCRNTGQPEGEAAAHLWGRLGVLLQRGNAAILGSHVPAPADAIIDGIMYYLMSLKPSQIS